MVREWGAMEEDVLLVDGLFIVSEAVVDAFVEDRERFGGFVSNLDGLGWVVAVGYVYVEC